MAERCEDENGYIEVGNFKVFAWSISGLETCVVVRNIEDKFAVCFDMGYSCRPSLSVENVFISHAHMDHISALPQHITKRHLNGQKMAKYYVPDGLQDPLMEICKCFGMMNGNEALKNAAMLPVKPGDNIKLQKGYYVVPFPTVHRVESQGYILYKRKQTLKQEFRHLTPAEVGARKQKGDDIFDVTEIPDVAFTGDTTFETFKDGPVPPPDDLFKVKLLVMEASYIDEEPDKDMAKQARERGHTHLSEIYDNAQLFKDVGHILLIHFSDKYSLGHIRDKVYKNVPEILKDKIIVSTLAKQLT